MSVRLRRQRSLGALLCLLVVGGCAQVTPGPEQDAGAAGGEVAESVPGSGAPSRVGQTPLRRLTNFEYRNTLTDLLGDAELVASATGALLNESDSAGFRNDAATLTVTPVLAQTYLDVAAELAPAIAGTPGLVPCDVDSPVDTPRCAEQFVREFGLRTFRRPLTSDEVAGFARLYEQGVRETGSFRTALEWVGAGMLTSLPFLFRLELPVQAGAAPERATAFDMASRLSYLLWQSTPDAELLRAAGEDQLSTPDQVAGQVARMLGDARSLRVYEFFEQWLDLDEADNLLRTGAAYADVASNLPALLKTESRMFLLTLLTENGTFGDLLTADYTFANRQLAEHYGLNTIPPGTQFERVPAPGRFGILTQGMLSVHDRPDRTSIVRRGVKLRTDILCLPPPPPPENADITLPEADGTLSQRERLEQHRSGASCRGCHAVIDPLGVLFESFDAAGRPRERDELGHAVDTTGVVVGLGELDGEYAGAKEFAAALATSPIAQACLVEKAFRFFYGRRATADDSGSLEALNTIFAKNGYRLADLIVGLTTVDQFLYKKAAGVQP